MEHSSAQALEDSYQGLREGLLALERSGRLHFLDASRILNGEQHTVFTDMWHFTDFGHELLAAAMAQKVMTLK